MKRRLSLETTIPSYLTAVRERLQLLQRLPLLDITAEVGALTSSFRLPIGPATDAAQISLAAVQGMDFLVT
jgi:hypothetical protein